MTKGTVKKWLTYRGFGFITPEDESDDIFVHNSDIEGTNSLKEGEKVEFEIIKTYKGPKAVHVKRISE